MKREDWLPVIVIVGMLLVYLVLTGCALLPDVARVEAEHVSHITQHYGPEQGHFGHESIGLAVEWRGGPVRFDLADYYSIDRLDGYHEVFEARVAYEIPLRRP